MRRYEENDVSDVVCGGVPDWSGVGVIRSIISDRKCGSAWASGGVVRVVGGLG